MIVAIAHTFPVPVKKKDQNIVFLPARIASCSAINNKTAKQILFSLN